MRRTTAAMAALALLLTACAGTDDDAPDATPTAPPIGGEASAEDDTEVTPEPSPEPTSPEPDRVVDVTSIPPVDQIDETYVEAVHNTLVREIDALYARVLREPVNPLGAFPAELLDDLSLLAEGPRYEFIADEFEAFAGSQAARDLLLPPDEAGNTTVEVLQVSYAEPSCIIAVTRTDNSSVAIEGGPSEAASFTSFAAAPNGDGPTAWRILSQVANRSGGQPNPDDVALSATLTDLDTVLANDCVGGEESRVAP